MVSKRYLYSMAYWVMVLGIILSGYLLFHYYSVANGKSDGLDLCSILFDNGCNATVYSRFSTFLKIPVGGWGLIYLAVVGIMIFLSQNLFIGPKDEAILIAFWILSSGVSVSLFFIVLMIIYPVLFCPFCTIFHALNILLFYIVKRLSKKSYIELTKELIKYLGVIFLAKPTSNMNEKWKWYVLIVPFIMGITIYQWSLIQGMDIEMQKLKSYDPLQKLEEFELREVWNINNEASDPVLGIDNAPVTLVVFSDFQCYLCEMFATNFEHLIAYNKGKLNIKFKYFPLCSDCNSLAIDNLHPLGCKAARAAESARLQGRFWEYHDSLYARGIDKDEKVFFEVAKSLNLDMQKFKMDYNSEVTHQKIKADIEEGIRLGLNGTPSAFLNGRMIKQLSQENINLLTKFSAQ